MIQYGIIKELKPEENSAIVRIPMYETSQGEEALFDCVLTITPGIINGYKEGDIVTVAFENNQLDLPVIINKLYTGVAKEQESETSAFLDNLYVEGSTELSENFKVGEVTYKDLLSLKKKLNIDENNVDTTQENLDKEINRAIKAEETLQENLDSETERAIIAEAILDDRINQLAGETEESLANEIERAIISETILLEKIEELTNRINELENKINNQ